MQTNQDKYRSINYALGRLFSFSNYRLATFMKQEQEKLVKAYPDKVWSADGIDFTCSDGLNHANSVSTVLSYIKHQKMYSREYGDTYFEEEQTDQRSDSLDMQYAIFFDNCDIRMFTGKQSVYGLIMLVINEDTTEYFRKNFQYHITIWEKEYLPLSERYVKYILVERHEDIEVSTRSKDALEGALEDAGIAIPVIIRTNTVAEHVKPANSIEELWEIPEE